VKHFDLIRMGMGRPFIYKEASDQSLDAHAFFMLCYELAKHSMNRRKYVTLDLFVNQVSVLISRGIGCRYRWESLAPHRTGSGRRHSIDGPTIQEWNIL
jgi:DUF2075 family protein